MAMKVRESETQLRGYSDSRWPMRAAFNEQWSGQQEAALCLELPSSGASLHILRCLHFRLEERLPQHRVCHNQGCLCGSVTEEAL